ncbi:MAG: AMP-dependent synthetase/ligase [Dermatophilaceae bacterium]
MQETSTPIAAPATTAGTLADVPRRWATDEPERVLFAVRADQGWADVTAAAFAAEVTALAQGFAAAGIGVGDAVGIMSRTRYEWTLTDFALWSAGAVPVPIYETSSAEQVQWILADSGAVGVVVETARHLAVVEQVRESLPGLRHLWGVDRGDLDRLGLEGADLGERELESRRSGLDRTALATIIYTSGTTGRPKGVELTHGNFLTLAENAAEELATVLRTDGASTLLFLPLAHVFARFVEVLAVTAGVRTGHSGNLATLLDDLAGFRPTFVLAVPRVFEKIYNSAEAAAEQSGRGRVFAGAVATATAWSEAQDDGALPFGLRVRHALFDRLVYSRLRDALGGRMQYAVSGGAPLGTRLGHFFRGAGITVLEGYGLTETAAPATVNRPGALRIGTVGQPLPGVGVRIDEDGEVLVRGVGVFRGYHGQQTATADALVDGWLRTGDLGDLDDGGFLRITGRKKEMLVTAGGKNVAPAVLEDRLRAHPLVGQCIVVGDGQPFIAALVTLDDEMYPSWAATHGLDDVPFARARTDERVLAEIQRAVDDANAAVSTAESIRKFTVLDTDFTVESGHLTPSLKLKRGVVMRDFSDEVDALYGG